MNITKIKIADINAAPYNPRRALRPGDGEYEALRRSIEEFGFVEPLVWNSRTGTLVSGHQRLTVLKAQGLTEVEASVVDLPIEKEKALNLALNKIRGEWDDEKLALILDELVKLPDFDEALSGFEHQEISQILDRHIGVDDDDLNLDAELAAGPAVTQAGLFIAVGPHRILCGDTIKEESYKILLGEEKIDLVHMDCPYGVSYDAKNRPGNGKKVGGDQWKPIQNDDLKGKDHAEWIQQVLSVLKPFLKENASVYFWDGFVNFGPVTQILTENGFHVSNVITWVKPNPCPSFSDYWFQSEFLLYGWLKSETPHRWFGPKAEKNVWFVDREPTGEYQHPTMKPTELARRVIKNSSVRGDIVYDGCMGAGFNILACQQLERVFRGVEIEPIYVDIAVRRYIRMFGKNSVSTEIFEKYNKEETKNG